MGRFNGIATAQTKQAQNIAAVTKEEIERVATKYLDPDRVVIVIVGNAKQIREPLGTLGYPLHELDIEGNAVAVG
jgi:zinc protease